MTTPRGPLSESGYQTFDELKEMHKAYANAVEVATRYERQRNAALARAEKAEAEALSWKMTAKAGGAMERDLESKLLTAEAQVAALRGQVEQCRMFFEENCIENPKDEIEKRIDWGMKLMLKKISEIPASELGKAVQGVIEAARRISPCNPMPELNGNEFIGWKACTCYRCAALSRLDAAMGKVT